MEIKFFKRKEKEMTRFKIGTKEINNVPEKVIKSLGTPCKVSSRYYYWEVEGDLLNGTNKHEDNFNKMA